MAYEFFVPLKFLDLLNRLCTVSLISIALFFGGNVFSLVFINGIVALAISICRFFYLRNHTNIKISVHKFNYSAAKRLFSFSFWVFLISIAQRLRLNIVPSILGNTTGTDEIAIFAVGMNLEGFIYIFSNALNGLFIPKVSSMVKDNKDSRTITNLMIRVGRIQLFIVGFVIVGLFGLGRSFINLWIGNDYENTYYVMISLIAPNLISMTQQIGVTLSYVKNEIRYNSIIALTTSILSFVLSLLLAPIWGAIGCSIAVFIALTINVLWNNIFYKKKLHLDVILFFKQCHFKIMPLLFFFLICLSIVDNVLDIQSWNCLIVLGVIYSILLFSSYFLFIFNNEEKLIFKSFVNKMKRF